MRMILAAAFAVLTVTPLGAQAQAQAQTPPDPVAATLAEAGPGTRWGLVIADEDGREIVAINPEGRFVPASNTKLYTTAAALWAESRGEGPQLEASGATVRLSEKKDVLLRGHGDARMSARPDCTTNCLATLADAIAARTKRVRDVIGDASLIPDQRWSPGMSWNNIPTNSGTAVAALVVDDNEIAAMVTPSEAGAPPVVSMPAYLSVRLQTHEPDVDGNTTLTYDRMPGSRTLVLTGAIPPGQTAAWKLGVDDPAHYAAWTLAEMLKARGVRVTGAIRSHYCTFVAGDGAASRCGIEVGRSPLPLARLAPGPLSEAVAIINKRSQNLHAELLLRRLGLARAGNGSIAAGQAMVSAMLAEAEITPEQVSLYDGSGMSSYNRVAPRATVRLLLWAARQPWAEAFRSSLPVGGVDGTLQRRFAGTALAGRIFAKTGTLNATNALAGWFIGASGRRFTFAAYANDVPETLRATALMDRALVAFAATR